MSWTWCSVILIRCVLMLIDSPLNVEAMDYVNVALGKPAKQVDIDWNGAPAKAVDGNPNPHYEGWSCTHTSSGSRRWWLVDLMASHPITSIVIYNRDTFPDRLSNFYVYISDVYPRPIPSPNGDFTGELCFGYAGSLAVGGPFSFNCTKSIYGRYVYVFKTTTSPLTLCEFEVLVAKEYLYVQEKRLIYRAGRKSTLNPFYSNARNIHSKLQCAVKCLSRSDGISTIAQFDLKTKQCDCIQKSRLLATGGNYISNSDWTMMEIYNN